MSSQLWLIGFISLGAVVVLVLYYFDVLGGPIRDLLSRASEERTRQRAEELISQYGGEDSEEGESSEPPGSDSLFRLLRLVRAGSTLVVSAECLCAGLTQLWVVHSGGRAVTVNPEAVEAGDVCVFTLRDLDEEVVGPIPVTVMYRNLEGDDLRVRLEVDTEDLMIRRLDDSADDM